MCKRRGLGGRLEGAGGQAPSWAVEGSDPHFFGVSGTGWSLMLLRNILRCQKCVTKRCLHDLNERVGFLLADAKKLVEAGVVSGEKGVARVPPPGKSDL